VKIFNTTFLIILLFNSIGFSQSLWNSNNEISSPDSIPVIYIPGIMGSPLYDDINNDNKLTIDEKAWMGIQLPSVWLAENGIDPAGNYNIKVAPLRNDAANTLWNELNDIPMDLFKGFFDNLEANGYTLDNYDDVHNEGENLFCFTYDWRKNNTNNAELLSAFIDSVMTWTGAASVNLIGHSMGGIVSKQCINLFDKSRIDKMVFIGTPHLGAPEILTVLLTGKLFV
jgi:pimeloyl-ACP methyl ester carboxylesterase